MTETIVIHETTRYDRQTEIDGWNQEQLHNARVFVAGAGALGNEILKNLALLGVGQVFVVDMDHIARHNLTRSVLFRDSDEGRSKAQVAAEQMHTLNPDVTITPIVGNLIWDVGWGLLRRMDLILGGLDNIEARLRLNAACMRLQLPWIDAALHELSGLIRMYHPDDACFECGLGTHQFQEIALRYSCQNIPLEEAGEGVPTITTSASLIAAMQVQEGLRWLHEGPRGHSLTVQYTAESFLLESRTISRRASCYAHDPLDLAALHSLPDVHTGMTLRALREVLAARLRTDDFFIELDREVVYRQECSQCGSTDERITPKHHITRLANRCPECGHERELYSLHRLNQRADFLQDETLNSLGVPPLHILKVKVRGEQPSSHYFELSGDIAAAYPTLSTEK